MKSRVAQHAAPAERTLNQNTRHSFVLALWLEPRQGAAGQVDPEWRWRVRCVQTGTEAYFRRIGDLLAHIAEQSGMPPPE